MSRKKAIESMCKQCIYDDKGGNGTWRQQTEACTAKSCPLYDYRPLSNGEKKGGRRVEAGKETDMADWWCGLLRQRHEDGRSDAEKDIFDMPYPGSEDPQDEAENDAYKKGFMEYRREIYNIKPKPQTQGE